MHSIMTVHSFPDLHNYVDFRSIALTQSNPAGVVSVCPGEDLHFICSTNLSIIEWNITVVQSESGQADSRTKFVTDISPPSTLVVSGISFTLTRNSTLRSRPLTSIASIANVTAGSNGMIVKCTATEQLTSERESSLVTIDVIDISELQNDFIHLIAMHSSHNICMQAYYSLLNQSPHM